MIEDLLLDTTDKRKDDRQEAIARDAQRNKESLETKLSNAERTIVMLQV